MKAPVVRYGVCQMAGVDRTTGDVKSKSARMSGEAKPNMSEAELKRDLAAANLHIEELNHRVMNNLAIIGAILNMERRAFVDEKVCAAFDRMHARISAVGALYRNTLLSESVRSVRADNYLAQIFHDIIKSAKKEALKIVANLSVSPIELPSKTALALGIVVNELITNSLKHAFKDGEKGVLGLGLGKTGGALQLIVYDSGCGIDEAAQVDSGLGSKLAKSFAAQLQGTLTTESDGRGTTHTLTFPYAEVPLSS